MTANRLDISDSFTWQEDLPRPQWDVLSAWVQNRVEPEECFEAWTDIARQWLSRLSTALDGPYELSESDHVLLLAPAANAATDVLGFAERCRTTLLASLPEVMRFKTPGKQAVLIISDTQTYYTYLSVYYPEGHHGGSGGVHVREGYPHIAVHGTQTAETTLAHELTHAALAHLTLPVWIEEGLAQMFEHDMSGRGLLQVDAEMARAHKRYWKKRGLELFWRGEGFSRPDKAQKLSYQLAEILLRLLCSDHRPRWFGLDQRARRRLLAFLREADACDCGEAAARNHLGFSLSELACKFLGRGKWSPGL